jgi:hypothetical protein
MHHSSPKNELTFNNVAPDIIVKYHQTIKGSTNKDSHDLGAIFK